MTVIRSQCKDEAEYLKALRDDFAAAALPALIAAYVESNGRCIGTEHFVSNLPTHAYRMADAMLAKRNK